MRTNAETLITSAVVGIISDNSCGPNPAMVGSEGQIVNFYGTGGIAMNVSVGDSAFGWAADHIEPGVSLIHTDDVKSRALNHHACVGNRAVVIKAAMNDIRPIVGKEGIVTGKHGGAERVLVWFDRETLSVLTPDDLIRIETRGFNLVPADYPDIFFRNMSPDLLDRLPVEDKSGKISMGISRILPGSLMGSGIGSSNTLRGDVDIQTTDSAMVKRYSLEEICLGDILAVTDYDTTNGASARKGSVTIGIVVHGTSRLSGHGPGVIPLITTRKKNLIDLYISPLNIADLYDLRPGKGA